MLYGMQLRFFACFFGKMIPLQYFVIFFLFSALTDEVDAKPEMPTRDSPDCLNYILKSDSTDLS